MASRTHDTRWTHHTRAVYRWDVNEILKNHHTVELKTKFWWTLHSSFSKICFSLQQNCGGNIYYQERAFGIFKLCTTIQYKSRPPLHSMPSNSGKRKSASWHRVEIKLQVSGSSWWGGVECINLSLMAFCLRLYASKVLISKSFGRESKQNIFSDNISSWLHLCIILSPQNESEIK